MTKYVEKAAEAIRAQYFEVFVAEDGHNSIREVNPSSQDLATAALKAVLSDIDELAKIIDPWYWSDVATSILEDPPEGYSEFAQTVRNHRAESLYIAKKINYSILMEEENEPNA